MQWALVWLPAVGLSCAVGFVACTGVVLLEDCTDVFYAAMTYLYCVSVEYFVQFAVFWEMGVDELEEFPSYVCCYAPVEW